MVRGKQDRGEPIKNAVHSRYLHAAQIAVLLRCNSWGIILIRSLVLIVMLIQGCAQSEEMKKHRIKITYEVQEFISEEVETEIVVPVETIVQDLQGVESINSIVMAGRAEITVHLLSSKSGEMVLKSVKDALTRSQDKLPQSVKALARIIHEDSPVSGQVD